ncbi:MAG TPA: indolepyruvate ferredoxin oxidoreductase subunit alpha [bacterium]|nr:indolepyruvate ferredoxin oxidoreductase subunit alpha [bacterium]
MKDLYSGNEAIARGAWEAGCKVASAYPGTPSTEIIENIIRYPEINAEWSPNEKVALEVGAGAAMAGARALVAMKHVGVNVAADPLFTLSYTGVKGGLVVVTADDPAMHSSQNEQDSRHYARAAKLPMLEPADSRECLEFVKLAFAMSEEHDCPVMLRTTTRISHGLSLVSPGERAAGPVEIKVEKNPGKWVMLPAFARGRHPLVEDRMKKLIEVSEKFPGNRIEPGDKKIGIITSGVAYQYAREAFPDASFLKLGMVWPLPEKMIREFAGMVEKLFVVEELDPFLEMNVLALGIAVTGKAVFPILGELSPALVRAGVTGEPRPPAYPPDPSLPPRPPILCPGCPHRGLFTALARLKAFVCGDIGCYTLAAPPPLSALDTCLCMGAGIGQSFGMEKALGDQAQGKVCAVIGDSTFFHSGITPLMDMVFNRSKGTVIILDNRTTAMTGRQGNPGAGYDACNEVCRAVDLEDLARGLGVGRVRTVQPYDLDATEQALCEEMNAGELSVVIAKGPCMLIPAAKEVKKPPLQADAAKCTGCKICFKVACPAIYWVAGEGTYLTRDGKTKKRKGYVTIDPLFCTGCGVCAQVCEFDAIK